MSDFAFRWSILTLDISCKICLLAAVAAFGLRLLRVQSSNVRHLTWVGVLCGILALPVLSLTLPRVALPLPGRLDLWMPSERISHRAVRQQLAESAAPAETGPLTAPANGGKLRQVNETARGTASNLVADAVNNNMQARETVVPTRAYAVPQNPKRNEPKTALATAESGRRLSRQAAAPEGWLRVPISWSLVAALVWEAGVLLLATRLLVGIVFVRRLVRRATPLVPSSTSALPACLREFAEVDIRESMEILVPVTVALARSIVLLPESWGSWPDSKLRNVLSHERAHVRRHDCLTAFLADLVVTLYWFHPIVWFLRRRLALLAEEACDDAAIGSNGNRTAYARHLLEIASLLSDRSKRGRLVSFGVSMARRSNVEDRINAILDSHRPRSGRLTWTAALAIAAGVVPLVSLAAALKPDSGSRPVAISSPAVPVYKPVAENAQPAETVANADVREPASKVAPAEVVVDNTDDGRLTLAGRLVLGDGAPAAGAMVSLISENNQVKGTTAHADAQGHFRLRNVYGQRCFLYAHTADWRRQAALPISPAAARITLKRAVTLVLNPAEEHSVLITSKGAPAAGVRVAAIGPRFKVEGKSGADGRAVLRLPSWRNSAKEHPRMVPGPDSEDVVEFDAWDPERGGVAQYRWEPTWKHGFPESVELLAPAPKPLTIRIVDLQGKPVANAHFTARILGKNGSLTADHFDEATLATNTDGQVNIPWAPAGATYLHVSSIDPPWKLDEAFVSKQQNGEWPPIRVRRLHEVTGRLVMPPGANPQGLLVSVQGYGPESYGQSATARARRDGTFTLSVAADHNFNVEVLDTEWTATPWEGLILPRDDARPAAVTLDVHRGIPVTVAVVKGPLSKPAAGVPVRVRWTDIFGSHAKFQSRPASVRQQIDLDTDARGIAQFAARRDRYAVQGVVGGWSHEQTVEVHSDQPVALSFERPWEQDHPIFGRTILHLMPRPITVTTTVRAWSVGSLSDRSQENAIPQPAAVETYPGGWFTVDSRADRVWIYARDRDAAINAFAEVGPNGGIRNLEFVPTAIYSGTVTDQFGKPLPGCRVRLIVKPVSDVFSPDAAVLDEVGCDGQGRFKFEAAPTDVTVLPLVMKPEADGRLRSLHTYLRNLRIKPGENFIDDRVAVLTKTSQTAPPIGNIGNSREPVEKRWTASLRDARLAHLRVLLLVEGDLPQSMRDTVHKLESDASSVILSYIPVVIRATERPGAAAFLARLKLAQPSAGELLLAAADESGEHFETLMLKAADANATVKRVATFLRDRAPAARDARQLFAAALEQAKATSRQVWVTEAGSRCGPCFQLARWLDDHRELLERDYVFVHLLKGVDRNVEALMAGLNQPEQAGIPWIAITDWRGNVLATSESPRGNIGFPQSVVGKRHFREMLNRSADRISRAEVDELIKTLP